MCLKEYGIFDWIFAYFYEFSPLIVVLRFRFAIFDCSVTYEVRCEFSWPVNNGSFYIFKGTRRFLFALEMQKYLFKHVTLFVLEIPRNDGLNKL